MKSEKSKGGLYFLLVVVGIYLAVFLWNVNVGIGSLNFAFGILKQVVWVFVLVFALMVVVNYYVTPKVVARHLKKGSGLKRWFIAVVVGIISTGPIYMWYPMLKELMKKGVSHGIVSVFLYSRAVKPAFLPLMVFYFGLVFTVVLSLVMIFMSVLQGMIFEKLEEEGFI